MDSRKSFIKMESKMRTFGGIVVAILIPTIFFLFWFGYGIDWILEITNELGLFEVYFLLLSSYFVMCILFYGWLCYMFNFPKHNENET